MKKALAIDVGGTKISYAVIDENGNFLTEIKKFNTPKTKEEIVELLKSFADEKGSEVDVVAIATAGCVNKENTRVVGSTGNLPKGYSDIDFSQLSDKKVFVENDANAAAWAEFKIGSAKDYSDCIILTIGTGIGAGVIVDGKLLKGAKGLAAEVGSMKIYPDNRRKCTCNNFDCWESYASGTGLRTNMIEAIKKHFNDYPESILTKINIDEVTTYDLIKAVQNKDKFAVKIFDEWHNFLSVGIISLVNIFNPDAIFFSGGLCEFLEYNKLQDEVNSKTVVSDVVLKPSVMKNDSGMIGTALLALEKLL